MSERYKNISQMAEMFNLDRGTIAKRLKNIQPVEQKAKLKTYDMAVAAKAIFELQGLPTEKEMLVEQYRYEKARADKIELEVREREGLLVPVLNVAKVVGSEYANVRTRLLSISSRCAKDLSLESDPVAVQRRLDEEVNEALAELSADEKFQNNERIDDEPESSDDSEGREAEEP